MLPWVLIVRCIHDAHHGCFCHFSSDLTFILNSQTWINNVRCSIFQGHFRWYSHIRRTRRNLGMDDTLAHSLMGAKQHSTNRTRIQVSNIRPRCSAGCTSETNLFRMSALMTEVLPTPPVKVLSPPQKKKDGHVNKHCATQVNLSSYDGVLSHLSLTIAKKQDPYIFRSTCCHLWYTNDEWQCGYENTKLGVRGRFSYASEIVQCHIKWVFAKG